MLPTLAHRIHALDLLRGIAILGILLANIKIFAFPVASELVSYQPATADSWIDAILAVFVTGKFRAMLAILFGVGIYLQYRKRSQILGNWPGGYMKRAAILAGIGLLHGLLIWWGDILFLYSILAFVTCLFASLSPKWLTCIAIALGLLTVCAGVLFAALTPHLAQAGESPGDLFSMFTASNETAIHAHGSWLEQLHFRALLFAFSALSVAMLAPMILPLFVLGLLIARQDVLQAPSNHPQWRARCLWIGFGIGLPLNLLALPAFASGRLFEFTIAQEFAFAPWLAIGYLMLGAMWAESGRFRKVANAIARVGRVALTTYLMQSVLCTFAFYSWGLGLFGKLTMSQSLGVVAGVWTVNVVFAWLWLRRFDIGPAEWLWRSLTEGRRQPWRAIKTPPIVSKPKFEI